MKVRVHYSDGSYWLQAYCEAHAQKGLPCVEISDADWRKYQGFLDMSKTWHMWMRDLDNKQYYLEYPEEQMSD